MLELPVVSPGAVVIAKRICQERQGELCGASSGHVSGAPFEAGRRIPVQIGARIERTPILAFAHHNLAANATDVKPLAAARFCITHRGFLHDQQSKATSDYGAKAIVMLPALAICPRYSQAFPKALI
jgi:hypothetical protein